MRSGAVPPCPARVNLLLEAVDVLRRLLDAARSGSPVPEEAAPTADSLLIAQRAGVFPPQTPDRPVRKQDAGGVLYRVRFRPGADLFRQGLDPALVIRDLGRIGELLDTALDSSRLPALEDFDPETWLPRLEHTPESGCDRAGCSRCVCFRGRRGGEIPGGAGIRQDGRRRAESGRAQRREGEAVRAACRGFEYAGCHRESGQANRSCRRTGDR